MIRKFALAATALVVFAAGCASFDGRGLVPGRSTQADVEALMGAPAQRLALSGGEVALYFSRLPEGRAVFVVTIGPDGVMKSIEQRLDRKNLSKIIAGTSTREDVRGLFGPPGLAGRLPRQERDWWEYKYFDYAERRVIWVQFSDDGVVREVLDMLDWNYVRQGHPNGTPR